MHSEISKQADPLEGFNFIGTMLEDDQKNVIGEENPSSTEGSKPDRILRQQAAAKVNNSDNSVSQIIPYDLVSVNEDSGRHAVRNIAQENRTADDDYIWSEGGLSDQYIDKHGDDFRYCDELGGWFAWDGKRWSQDKADQSFQRVKQTIRYLINCTREKPMTEENKKLLKFLARSETAARCQAILKLSQPELATPIESLDKDDYILNLKNGTLDLSTDKLSPHRREDLLTKIV